MGHGRSELLKTWVYSYMAKSWLCTRDSYLNISEPPCPHLLKNEDNESSPKALLLGQKQSNVVNCRAQRLAQGWNSADISRGYDNNIPDAGSALTNCGSSSELHKLAVPQFPLNLQNEDNKETYLVRGMLRGVNDLM